MTDSASPRKFLELHLQSIFTGDVEAYHATAAPDLTIYEWYVTPHRIDGLPFHDFMLAESLRPDTPATALDPDGDAGRAADRVPRDKVASEGREKARERFDLANYHEQVYGDCAVCCYTLLISRATSEGTRVLSHHETRVLVRNGSSWRVVHVHKSPAWNAPYQPAG